MLKKLVNVTDSEAELVSAIECINYLQQLVDVALSKIKADCTKSGSLDSNLLDDWQLSSYDLAFCVSEFEAARAFSNYAVKTEYHSLTTRLALFFIAEVFQSCQQRLSNRAKELGLNRKELLNFSTNLPASNLLDNYLHANFLDALGSEICDDDIKRLPSLLDDEIELVRETFFRFTNEIVMPLAEKIHREDQDIPEAILKPAADLGCFGTCIPERFGGSQPDDKADSIGMIIVTEELSRGSLGAAGSLITRPEIVAKALLSGGTTFQQNKWLPKLATGEIFCAVSITEPSTGSDVAAVSLRAKKSVKGWLLNGSKTWCTFAGRSELIVVLARTNPDLSLGHKGLSMFLVEKPAYPGHAFEHMQGCEGSLVGKAIATLGYRGMHSYDLFFENYFVPEENLVGEELGEGKGFYYTMSGFSGGRIQTAARATGVMQAAFEKGLSYAKDRKVFGKAIADYQLTKVKLSRMLATLTASRQFGYAVAELMDKGGGQMEASLVKLFTCRAAEWITREALQIHGGMGYAEETTVSRLFVDARVLSIFEGAEETLALKVIARTLIANAK